MLKSHRRRKNVAETAETAISCSRCGVCGAQLNAISGLLLREGQPIAGRVDVSRWLSTLKFLNTLNELIFLLVVNTTLLSLHCAI